MDKKAFLKKFSLINVGVLLVAAGFYYFMDPNNLAPGGVTGLSKVINYYVPQVPLSVTLLILNTILFIIGISFIGKEFGVLTIYSFVALSVYMRIMEIVTPLQGSLTGDVLIELIFGSAITAVGLALVFNQGTSTGGTDIIAKILNKYFHMDIGKGLLVADTFVTIFAITAFGLGKGLYSVLGVFMVGYLIDSFIEGFNINKKIEIITCEGEKIKKFIIEDLDRSATLYVATGAYSGEEKEIITTVVGKKQFIKLKSYIKDIDKKAFIITYNVHETVGEGFKSIEE